MEVSLCRPGRGRGVAGQLRRADRGTDGRPDLAPSVSSAPSPSLFLSPSGLTTILLSLAFDTFPFPSLGHDCLCTHLRGPPREDESFSG